ncbi:MAG TPA: chloride channel protein [Candidatus Paraprevotella stercorigallinarum]|jgi:CIC family chloride channel protein|nr:chloride channel protein [Candidatus Paraprevotella stercorigallinarum]
MRNTASRQYTLFERLFIWRRMHFSEHKFILLLSFIVGIFTALAGLLLKWLIHQIQFLLTYQFDVTASNLLYLVYPVIGIFLTGLFVRYIVKDDISHGVTKILFAIARKQSQIKSHNTWSSVFASAITIGFGGSVGAEAPIVLTGSAIGSNLGRIFGLNNKTLMLLVGCGAAGAVAGIFKAPIAGLVFTLEVLMIDLTMASLLPLLVSCVTAAGLTFALSGTNTIFEFHLLNSFAVNKIPAYIMLGIFCGLVSLYFTRTMNSLEDIFRKYTNPYIKLLIGGSMLSILIYLFPSLYGEGYDLIDLLLNGEGPEDWDTAMDSSLFYGHGNLLLLYLALVLIFKVFASTATNGGGGCGGIFAPSLFLGCISGFIFSRIWNINEILHINLPERNFAMLGMCGLMSGVMHAPLTGIFLIAELTGGYQLFMPLMIVSVCAYLTIIAFEPHSIYSMRLAKKGQLLTHHKDRAILTLMSMDSVIEKYDEYLYPDMDLRQLVSYISNSRRDVFPVVDRQHKLVGIVYLDNVRPIMFRQELYHRFKISELMSEPVARLNINDSMDVVVMTFDKTGMWTLPVVDTEGIFMGFIRKSRVLTNYRKTMADLSDD